MCFFLYTVVNKFLKCSVLRQTSYEWVYTKKIQDLTSNVGKGNMTIKRPGGSTLGEFDAEIMIEY